MKTLASEAFEQTEGKQAGAGARECATVCSREPVRDPAIAGGYSRGFVQTITESRAVACIDGFDVMDAVF